MNTREILRVVAESALPAALEFVATSVVEKAVALAARYQRMADAPEPRHLVVMTPDHAEAVEIHAALAALISPWSGDVVKLLGPWEVLPFEPASLEPSAAAGRVEAIAALARELRRGDPPALVVVSAVAGSRKVFSKEVWRDHFEKLAYSDEIPPAELRRRLVAMGYRATTEISDVGEFVARGGILDLFTPGARHPARIEWDGDLIASIRFFDIQSQLSIEPIDNLEVLPAREIVLPQGDVIARVVESITTAINPSLRRDAFLDAIATGSPEEGVEILAPFLSPMTDLLALGEFDTIAIDPDRSGDRVRDHYAEAEAESRESDLGYDASLLWTGALPEFAAICHSLPREGTLRVASEALPPAPIDATVLRVDLRRLLDRGVRIVIVSSMRARVKEVLAKEKLLEDEAEIAIEEGSIESGAVFPELGVAVVTDGDLFGRQRRKDKAGRRRKTLAWGSLRPGEYVVHVNHGVGIYRGIERIKTLGEFRDVVTIEYAGEDRVYLPPQETTLIERYSVPEGAQVRLDKLGAASWSKMKSRVESETRELARELLDLYALRSEFKGTVFEEIEEERRFAEAFGYETTPDQQRSIDEVCEDLAKERAKLPMDRLLCGDVGFGKTEVAIRAAFRVVRSGRQAAVLCPTTILALQHGETFRARLEPFGISVGTLSRFQSAKEAAEVERRLGNGELGVVVGTHRLLGRSVRFHSLGLVVIDEEQRFGVRHKEYLKNLRKQVDILTMTATPIPRTLNLALSGVRGISLIETPPPGRAPVQTVVEPFSESHMVRSIRRELERDGQVFYVHNRVATIDRVFEYLKGLFPKTTIEVGHGQMDERELEGVMRRFLSGKTAILLSTSIVENGLDIPRANTIIVDQAQNFGLSDLYQLRGRVGRSKTRAYAYFFYSSDAELTRVARARLAAIAEHTSLGSGYAIARKDMELRGAGEILGKAQSGEMNSVGYDMYCRLLREAMSELRGEKARRRPRAVVDIAVEAYVPEGWLGSDELVTTLHRKISEAETIAAVDELRENLIDRFGSLPEPVENLLGLGRLRACADLDGVESIVETPDAVTIRWKRVPDEIASHVAAIPPPVYTSWTGPALTIEHLPTGRAKVDLLRRIVRR